MPLIPNVDKEKQAVMVYTTYPSLVEAEEAGRALTVSRGYAPASTSFPAWSRTTGGRAKFRAAKRW